MVNFKDNPEIINRNGRGKTKYVFTVDSIASFIGRSVQTVRNHKSSDGLDFNKLGVLFRYMRRFK